MTRLSAVFVSAKPGELLLLYMALMSVVLFVMMGADKRKAKKGRRRISEKSLFICALIGGAVGGFAGMHVFRHKTRHWYFRLGFPLIAIVQIALWIYFFLI